MNNARPSQSPIIHPPLGTTWGLNCLGTAGICAAVAMFAAGCQVLDPAPQSQGATSPASSQTTNTRDGTTPVRLEGRPPYSFTQADAQLLESVQRGAFNFLFDAVNPNTKLVPDRLKNPRIVSAAGVGFQLSALPVGVERGWITRAQGVERANDILRSLSAKPEIVKAGLFQHFIDADTAGMHGDKNLEHVVSTIDSALLLCGLITASSYFGGDIAQRADAMFAAADFSFFVGKAPAAKPWEEGFISLGWKPDSLSDGAGAGKLLPYFWIDSGCEHRLTAFLAVAAPNPAHRLEPTSYYKLRRALGDANGATVAWFPYSGALFTNQFSHCWINYASMGKDNPGDFGFDPALRAPIDWWQNARDVTLFHRAKAIELASTLITLNENAWGFTASDCAAGYCVPGIFPKPLLMPGARENFDYSSSKPTDQYGDGTVAPYAAGTSLMFTPAQSLAALKNYITITDAAGTPRIWKDPATTPGAFGFSDAFNTQKGWYAEDYVSIDQGPLLLAIENARTGLIWKLFHAHPAIKAAQERLGWKAR